jgi:hydroxyacylglutathione hydrolase
MHCETAVNSRQNSPTHVSKENAMAAEFHQFMCLDDNFGVLVHDPASGATAAIDAPEASAVSAALALRGWSLTHILVTHYHHDHTDGIPALKAATGCTVVGPAAEADRIKGLDRTVKEPDRFTVGGITIEVLDTPGHSPGHICYYLPGEKAVFAGDTLFALGCGRLELPATAMWPSLQKLMRLPLDTALYCGHEYTLGNARFALRVEPDNAALIARAADVEAKRAAGQPTLPSTIGLELATNPFLRVAEKGIRTRLDMAAASDADVYGELRERKNRG